MNDYHKDLKRAVQALLNKEEFEGTHFSSVYGVFSTSVLLIKCHTCYAKGFTVLYRNDSDVKIWGKKFHGYEKEYTEDLSIMIGMMINEGLPIELHDTVTRVNQLASKFLAIGRLPQYKKHLLV